MKSMTRDQLQNRKERAVRFARDVREDDDLADQIENESLEDYAEHRHIRIANPTLPDRVLRQKNKRRGNRMPVPTRRELQERIEELEGENEDLQSRLDEIADLVAPEEEEEGNE